MSQPEQRPLFANLPKFWENWPKPVLYGTMVALAALAAGSIYLATKPQPEPTPLPTTIINRPATTNPATTSPTTASNPTTGATADTKSSAPSKGVSVQAIPLLVTEAPAQKSNPSTKTAKPAATQTSKITSPVSQKQISVNPFSPFAITPINPTAPANNTPESTPVAQQPISAPQQPVRTTNNIPSNNIPSNTNTSQTTRVNPPRLATNPNTVGIIAPRPLPTPPSNNTSSNTGNPTISTNTTSNPSNNSSNPTTQQTTNNSTQTTPLALPPVVAQTMPDLRAPSPNTSLPTSLAGGALPVAPSLIRDLVGEEPPVPVEPVDNSNNPNTSSTVTTDPTQTAVIATATQNVSPLGDYVKNNQMQLLGTVLGPLNTAVFNTKDGLVIVPLGGTIPNSNIVVQNITADEAVLRLGGESVTLKKEQ